MLTIHRRHTRICYKKRHLATAELDRCDCPLIVMGMDHRRVYHNREALHTRDKYVATQIVREIEEGKLIRPRPEVEEWTVEQAMKKYLSLISAQLGLKQTTVINNEACHHSLLKFTEHRNIKYFREITPTHLAEWVEGWKLAHSTKAVRIGMVKRMFEYAHKMKWIAEDPSVLLQSPAQNRQGSTEPFDPITELPKIMDAIPKWMEGMKFRRRVGMSVWAKQPDTAIAILYLLRFTGLRISDAFLFNPLSLEQRVIDGEEVYCFLAKRQRKTDYPVFLPLPTQYAKIIMGAKWLSDEHAFWDGKSTLTNWTNLFTFNVLAYLSRVSGVAGIHPHRFRDTFAMELLGQEIDIRTVSRLLGHKSLSTTITYYEHFVVGDQNKLLRIVMKGRKDAAENGIIPFPKQA